ncbi:MAG TPA: class I SAM-dependent methyltransferase [Lapillicoccus sp.]|nr:class I SAM-dependent methyltransferase [Lapillicoccus sp.]
MKPRTLVKVAREGSPRTRLRAFRDGRAAVRLAATRALLEAGLVDALVGADEPRDAAALARAVGLTDVDLTRTLLELGGTYGLVRRETSGWTLSRRGRALAADPTGRAMVEALGGYHLDLYRELPDQLRGGPGRDDLDRHAELIARVSSALAPFVRDAVVAAVQERRPQRVLDLGCGEGEYLAAMLQQSATAHGVGLETDARVAALARSRLEPLHGRGQVLVGSAPAALPDAVEALGGPADLVLLANVIYYVPPGDRAAFLREVAAATSPGGAVLVVTTVVEPTPESAHIGLLFRAQRVPMMLPTVEGVVGDLRRAGLATDKPRRVTPGEPIVAVLGVRQ